MTRILAFSSSKHQRFCVLKQGLQPTLFQPRSNQRVVVDEWQLGRLLSSDLVTHQLRSFGFGKMLLELCPVFGEFGRPGIEGAADFVWEIVSQ